MVVVPAHTATLPPRSTLHKPSSVTCRRPVGAVLQSVVLCTPFTTTTLPFPCFPFWTLCTNPKALRQELKLRSPLRRRPSRLPKPSARAPSTAYLKKRGSNLDRESLPPVRNPPARSEGRVAMKNTVPVAPDRAKNRREAPLLGRGAQAKTAAEASDPLQSLPEWERRLRSRSRNAPACTFRLRTQKRHLA